MLVVQLVVLRSLLGLWVLCKFDKRPLCLGCIPKAAWYMTTVSVWLSAEWHILSTSTRTHFCWAFWWTWLHATAPPPPPLHCLWNEHFVLVTNVSSKTAGQRQAQLSHRTVTTIVWMFAPYMCLWIISLQMQTALLKMWALSRFGRIWKAATQLMKSAMFGISVINANVC